MKDKKPGWYASFHILDEVTKRKHDGPFTEGPFDSCDDAQFLAGDLIVSPENKEVTKVWHHPPKHSICWKPRQCRLGPTCARCID